MKKEITHDSEGRIVHVKFEETLTMKQADEVLKENEQYKAFRTCIILWK